MSPHFPRGAIQDFLHDSVTVLFSTGQRQQDVKPVGLEGNKLLKADLSHVHIYIMRYLYLSIAMLRMLRTGLVFGDSQQVAVVASQRVDVPFSRKPKVVFPVLIPGGKWEHAS